jgi:hypothetical protein
MTEWIKAAERGQRNCVQTPTDELAKGRVMMSKFSQTGRERSGVFEPIMIGWSCFLQLLKLSFNQNRCPTSRFKFFSSFQRVSHECPSIGAEHDNVTESSSTTF